MATSTTNLGLTKPSVNDAADIGVLNSNFDKIDTKCNPALFAPSGYAVDAGYFSSDAMLDTKLKTAFNNVPSGKIGFAQMESTSTANTLFYGRWSFDIYRPREKYGYVIATSFNTVGVVILHRYLDNEVWGAWEWVNPPMTLGVEYRTTKRYDGHAVYTQMISCGKGPASGGANYYLNLSTYDIIFTQIRCKAVSPTSYWGAFLDHYISFGEYGSGAPCVSLSANAGDQSNRNIYLIVEYYKV